MVFAPTLIDFSSVRFESHRQMFT